jgi:hypothetical protein
LLQRKRQQQQLYRRLWFWSYYNKESDSKAIVTFCFGLTTAKKAMVAMLPSPFSFSCCSIKGDDNIAAITFGFGLVIAKNFFCYSVKGDVAVTFFYFGFVAAKEATAMSYHLLMWFHYSEEEEDDSFRHLLQWLCYKKMAAYTFFDGFATKKVTITMSLPSSMAVVL